MSDLPASPSRREIFVTSYRRGVMATSRISVFSFVFGILFMTAALSRGFTIDQALLMTVLVFAGSVLFAAMELWTEPLPYVVLAITAASVGCRHILMGMTLPSYFAPQVKRTPWPALFFLTDVNWLLTTKAGDVKHRYAFFLGSSTVMFSTWSIGALLGVLIVAYVDETTIRATRSMGTIFIALIIMMLARGYQGSRWPWLIAAVASGVMSLYEPQLAVLAGVLAGAITAGWQQGDRHAQ